mmetsp:Transcript_13467/g.21045  ORF Transcript_13467/g.21045 Transcript_13467/m.21045 type:complete len:117 (-) Transcript_13467:5091-5441(-)
MSRFSDANHSEWSNKKGRLTRVQSGEQTKRITLGAGDKETVKHPWRNSEASPRRLTSNNAPDFVSQRADVDSVADLKSENYQTGPSSQFNFRPSEVRPSQSKMVRPSVINKHIAEL